MREMDLLLGQFSDAHLSALSDSELGDYERLMDAPDADVFAWLTGGCAVPATYDTDLFRRLAAFHNHSGPIDL
jgi:antitoxin CptB